MPGTKRRKKLGQMKHKMHDFNRYTKRRIKQTPPKSAFKGLTSSQIRKLKKEN